MVDVLFPVPAGFFWVTYTGLLCHF
jgi:hypothetical protein